MGRAIRAARRGEGSALLGKRPAVMKQVGKLAARAKSSSIGSIVYFRENAPTASAKFRRGKFN